MLHTFRQLSIGLGLMALCIGVLLLSDLDSRVRPGDQGRRHGELPRVAVLQANAQWIFDEGVAGIIAGLAEEGFRDKHEIHLRKFNPMGDSNVSNSIAREVTEGGYDLIITTTTPMLQVVANANRARRVPQLFALVSIPSETGTGVSELDPLNHPPYLTGYGTRLPAAQAFRIAREINPRLQRIGTVWNPQEVNSEVQIRDARAVCKELGMELVDATVDNTGAVGEATASVIARGIEAFFIPGDITVMPAIHNVFQITRRANIPTFSIFPTDVPKGSLFGVGADYYEVGRGTGRLAAEVLRGRNTATIPVTDYMPEKIVLNEEARMRLANPQAWDFPESLRKRAYAIVTPEGALNVLRDDPAPGAPAPTPSPTPAPSPSP